MFTKMMEWLETRFWMIYTGEIILIVVLIIYGLFSQNGFLAKGY